MRIEEPSFDQPSPVRTLYLDGGWGGERRGDRLDKRTCLNIGPEEQLKPDRGGKADIASRQSYQVLFRSRNSGVVWFARVKGTCSEAVVRSWEM